VFRVSADAKDFLSYTMPRKMLRPTQPASVQLLPALFPWDKGAGAWS